MPKVKRSRKPPPDGWELIEPTIDELDQKMREGIVLRLRTGHGFAHLRISLYFFTGLEIYTRPFVFTGCQ